MLNKLLLLMLAIVVVACGYKGPLYLPNKPPAPAPVPVNAHIESSIQESAVHQYPR